MKCSITIIITINNKPNEKKIESTLKPPGGYRSLFGHALWASELLQKNYCNGYQVIVYNVL